MVFIQLIFLLGLLFSLFRLRSRVGLYPLFTVMGVLQALYLFLPSTSIYENQVIYWTAVYFNSVAILTVG
jgi:hypothetical protein